MKKWSVAVALALWVAGTTQACQSAHTEGAGGSGGAGGSVTDTDGDEEAIDCVQACNNVFDCGMTVCTVAWTEADHDAFMHGCKGCLALCEEAPELFDSVRLADCRNAPLGGIGSKACLEYRGYGDEEEGEAECLSGACNYAAKVLADQPIAYYRLDDDFDTMRDSGPAGRHGAHGEHVGFDACCRRAYAGVDLEDGDVSSVPGEILEDFWVGRQPFTIELWLTDDSDGGDVRYFFDKAHDGVGVELFIDEQSQLTFQRHETLVNTAHKFSRYRPMHIAATYDGTTMRLYTNAVLDVAVDDTTPLNATGGDLLVAGRGQALNGTHLFKGTLEHVAIYPRALDANAISVHYHCHSD